MRTAAGIMAAVSMVSTLALPTPAGAAAPPGAVLYDGFTRADSASLGQAETGQPWASWVGSPRVTTQQAEAPGGGYTLAAVDAGTATGTASVTVPVVSSEHWLVVRASDAANYWRFGRWQGGNYQLQQVANNGLGSPALTTSATVGAANGDRLSCQLATGLTCSVNGVTVVSTADTFNASARFTGFAAAGSLATRFDELSVTPPQPSPDLRIAVTASAPSVPMGSPVSWSATVTNPGARSATAARVTFTAPAGVTNVAASTPAGSCAPAGSTWTCSIGDRAVGSTATVTVNATAPSQPATLTLTATASAEEQDANSADNTASATITTPPGAVAVDGFDRADGPNLGQAASGQVWTLWSGAARIVSQQAEATGGYSLAAVDTTTATGTAAIRVPTLSSEYWLVVRATSANSYWRFGRWQNGGYQLQQVNNNALGSPALTVLSAPAPAAGDRLSCYLASGITCSVNGTAVVRTADTFNATAKLAGFAAGSNTATRFDDFLVTLPDPGPDLLVTLTGPGTVTTGSSVAWSGTVTNGGTRTATATVLTVTPPPNLANRQVTTSAGTCSANSGTWTCPVGSLAVGASLTVSVSGSAPSQAGTLTTTVSAALNETDVDPSTNSASATTSVRTPPPPGTVALDGFDRPDAASLGSAETGQAWTTRLGTTRLAGQMAEATGAGYTLATLDGGTAVGTASLTVASPSGEFWLVVRASDATNYWRFGRWQDGPYQLQQIVGNALGTPSVTTSATVAAAAGDRMACKLSSSAITCSVNGTVVASSVNSFNATARHVGFAAGTGAPARFDELLVVTPPPGPDLQVSVAAAVSAVQTGASVSWTATVRNDGTATATGTTVTVTPPSGLTSTAVTSSAGTCLKLITTWRCSVGSRAVGSSLTVTVTGKAPTQPTTLTLTVSASAQEADTDPASNSASASILVRAPAAPGSVVTDGFDRPNSATLGTADTGQPWSTVVGSFGVASGAAAPGGSGTGMSLVDPGWQYGTYEVTVTAGAAPNAFAVVVRGRDANNHVRIGPDSTGFYRMWKVVNGVSQPMAISIRRADLAPAAGDVIRIVNRPDDGLFVSVNGQHLLDAGDQDLLAESRFGLVASSSAVRFDNVWISQVMSSGVVTSDAFSSGDGQLWDHQTEVGTHYGWHASYGCRISAGRLTMSGYSMAWVDTTSELANARVEVRSGTAEAFLVFRYSENGDYYRFGHDTGGRYVVERVTSSSSTTVVQTNVSPQTTDIVEVRQFTDGRVEGYVNGTRIASFTNTTFSRRATAYGLEGNGAVFDNFVVTPK